MFGGNSSWRFQLFSKILKSIVITFVNYFVDIFSLYPLCLFLHLVESKTFLDLVDTSDDTPKPGLRRVKSEGDLPSPPKHLPRVHIGGTNIGAPPPLPVLLGSQAAETTCASKKKSGRRRNRRANTMVEGTASLTIARTVNQQDATIDDLAHAVKEANSSQAVFAIANQNMLHFDFTLSVLAV